MNKTLLEKAKEIESAGLGRTQKALDKEQEELMRAYLRKEILPVQAIKALGWEPNSMSNLYILAFKYLRYLIDKGEIEIK